MRVDLPSPGAYQALVLAGVTQRGSDEHDVMAVVLKGAYDLLDDGTGVHDLVPAADAARAALVTADRGRHLFTDADGDVHEVPATAFGVEPEGHGRAGDAYFDLAGERHYIDDLAGPENLGFDLEREGDLALDKEVCDVFVEGFTDPAAGAAVRVDGERWLSRTSGELGPLDTGRNLFGWQGRQEPPRDGVLSDSYDPGVDDALPSGDTAAFNNAYRRSAGFSAPGSLDLRPVPRGALVEVLRDEDGAGAAAFSARLPDLVVGARLRVYCGHGPDRGPRWRIVPLDELVPDTLLLRPAASEAEVLWRGRWPADLAPVDRYRSVQTRAGGF